MRIRVFCAVGLAAAALSSCVAPTPRPAPPVYRVVTPPPPPATGPTDAEPALLAFTPGVWRYSTAGSVASFGASLQPVVMIACERAARTVALRTRRIATSAADPRVTLRASTTIRTFPATVDGDWSVVRLPATDPMLDALAFSRGRIGVAEGGVERTLPTWPELTRVIEDCRG